MLDPSPNSLVHGERLEIWDYQLCEWSTPAGFKLARENLQSRVKEEDSITDVENAVFDLGVMDSLCLFFIDQRVLISFITELIKFIQLNFPMVTSGFQHQEQQSNSEFQEENFHLSPLDRSHSREDSLIVIDDQPARFLTLLLCQTTSKLNFEEPNPSEHLALESFFAKRYLLKAECSVIHLCILFMTMPEMFLYDVAPRLHLRRNRLHRT
ncbi:hypothetical protein Tco_0105097 [Tanacetum coccineum]